MRLASAEPTVLVTYWFYKHAYVKYEHLWWSIHG